MIDQIGEGRTLTMGISLRPARSAGGNVQIRVTDASKM